MSADKGADTQSEGGGLAKRALGGILWTLSSAAVKAVVQILVLMFLARLLAPEAFGLMAAALVVIRIAMAVADFGIGTAIIQKETLTSDDVSTSFCFMLASGAVTSLIIWWAAPAFAGFFQMPELALILNVLAPIILISMTAETAAHLLRRNLGFRQIAINVVIAYVVGYGVVGIGLAAFGAGSWALVGAFAAQMITRAVLFLYTQPHAKKLLIKWEALVRLMRFGLGIIAFKLANVASLHLDNLVVGRWLGAEALGLYDRAYQFSVMPASFLAQGVLTVLLPVMSQIQREKARMAESFRRGMTLAMLVTMPISSVIAILSPELVAILLGPQWDAAALPLAILSLGLSFRIGSRVTSSVATAMAAVYTMAWRQAFYAATVLLGALAGAQWGLSGVAAGMLLAQLANHLLMAQLAISLTTLSPMLVLRAHIPGLVTTALVAPAVWLVRSVLVAEGAGTLTIVVLAVIACGVILLSIVHTRPALILGTDGLWLIDALLARIPKHSRGPIARLLGRKLQQSAA